MSNPVREAAPIRRYIEKDVDEIEGIIARMSKAKQEEYRAVSKPHLILAAWDALLADHDRLVGERAAFKRKATFTLAQAKGYIRTVSEERGDGGMYIVTDLEEQIEALDAAALLDNKEEK